MDSIPMDQQRLVDFLTDPETSLLGRDYFLFRLEEEFKKSWRYRWPLSLVVADVDGFDQIRAEDGERGMRQTLLDISGELLLASRDTDLSSRIADARFAILLPGTDAVGAEAFVERVLRSVAEGSFGRLVLSIGGASAPGDDLGSSDEFLARALTGAQEARGKGRNAFVLWDRPSR
ncbi:MAG: GGDEF domain-containing protein [Planctomycetes bacterium]|nr:GGDEF domain-containing protein [Planctomycetota bacterium]